VFIAVEREAPYAVGVYRLLDEVIALGRAENEDLLRQYVWCQKNATWPGYGDQIQDIGIPVYGFKELEGVYGSAE
jgi:hypothetical protein